MNSQEFAIHPLNVRKVWLLPGAALLAAVAGIALLLPREPRAWIAMPVLLTGAWLLARIFRRRQVSLGQGVLTVASGLHTRHVPENEIDLAASRIVDLRERTELKPLFKTFGTRLPGLSMGHFRLRDHSRAFLLLTDTSRVLVLDERSGRRLLLSLARPQALLDALRREQQVQNR